MSSTSATSSARGWDANLGNEPETIRVAIVRHETILGDRKIQTATLADPELAAVNLPTGRNELRVTGKQPGGTVWEVIYANGATERFLCQVGPVGCWVAGVPVLSACSDTCGHLACRRMPIITISRGSFAGGSAVARALSERLGHPCLSREDVLARAAKDHGIHEEELRRALNEPPAFWEQMPGKRLAYVKCLTAVLLDHAREENLVYHGHVGHLLLAGVAHVLRVRVVADLEYRVRAAMSKSGLTREKALAHIHQVDEERSRWARLLYGVEWQDPTHYHLVVNLGQISVGSACETIVRMSEMEEFQSTEVSRRQLEDLRLAARVWAALAKEPITRSAGLHVVAQAGDVLITGNAGSAKAIELIPRIASAVEGVKQVRSEAGQGTDWFW